MGYRFFMRDVFRSLATLCESMRRQILFRAFYGWLAHCRHISGVRTHLTALVNQKIVSPNHPTDARVGITAEVWEKLAPNGVVSGIYVRNVFFLLYSVTYCVLY